MAFWFFSYSLSVLSEYPNYVFYSCYVFKYSWHLFVRRVFLKFIYRIANYTIFSIIKLLGEVSSTRAIKLKLFPWRKVTSLNNTHKCISIYRLIMHILKKTKIYTNVTYRYLFINCCMFMCMQLKTRYSLCAFFLMHFTTKCMNEWKINLHYVHFIYMYFHSE